jgi:uncharacterized protein
MFDYLLDLIGNVFFTSWQVLGQMSPYLLFGFFVAGILSVLFSPEWIERHLGGRGFGPVLKASLLGVPLPLCSCGVIPVSASIRRHGASRAATISFLLSTPQTGVDSIAVTWGLLGPIFGIFRPIAALVTGLLGGGLVQFFDERDSSNGAEHVVNNTPCAESCCTGKNEGNFILRALKFSFLTLPRDLGKSLLIGVLIAGVIGAIVSKDGLKPYLGNEILSIFIMIAAGIPLYVCATGSVPMAMSFIHAGVSPGAALAFLISGPATNAATISTTWKLLGKRATILYLVTIALSAVICGLAFDGMLPFVASAFPNPDSMTTCHSDKIDWLPHFWSLALLLVIGISYMHPIFSSARVPGHSHKHLGETKEKSASPEVEDATMQTLELEVPGMTCRHCVAAVIRALKECEGVQSVEVDLKGGRAFVTGNSLNKDKLVEAIKSLGL